MTHLRRNPLLDTYTMVAANRQQRPHLPQGQCPFCPGSGNVPDDYEVLIYPNDFPALSVNPEMLVPDDHPLFQKEEAYGVCDVILYSPDHLKGLADLPIGQVEKLVKVWAERYKTLAADKRIQYIFPFENRGEEVGVTIHHPHGQLYAYPFVPARVRTELINSKKYYDEHGENLFDDLVAEEKRRNQRIVYENESFVVLLPWFTDYPYGVYILSKKASKLELMDDRTQFDLAEALQKTIGAFDMLFNRPFPYMMCLYQAPVNEEQFEHAEAYYPFHIKFFPPLRSADKIKWMASSETGAGAAANTKLVEDCTVELQEALKRYEARGNEQ